MARVPVYSRHKRTDSPCYGGGKGCDKRVVGCHSTCEKWKEWKQADLERIKQANSLYVPEKLANDYVVTKIRNIKAKKGRS